MIYRQARQTKSILHKKGELGEQLQTNAAPARASGVSQQKELQLLVLYQYCLLIYYNELKQLPTMVVGSQ